MEQPIQNIEKQEQEINLRQLFEQYAFYWKWFILAVILSLGIALVYLRYAQKTYSTTAKILLRDERSAAAGELAGIAELTSTMGLNGGRSAFVPDQIEVLTSRRLMRKVVDQHHLNVTYFKKGNIRSSEVLEKDMPFILQPQGDLDTTKFQLTVRIQENKQLAVTDLQTGKKFVCGFDKRVKIGTDYIVFRKNGDGQNDSGDTYEITVIPKNWAVDATLSAIGVSPSKEMQSYIVNFAMVSKLGKKAELILNSLIDIYNSDLTNDKLRTTRATSEFINKRLLLISKDLSGADEEVADFKSNNSMVDMQAEAGVFLQNASENDKKALEYSCSWWIICITSSKARRKASYYHPT